MLSLFLVLALLQAPASPAPSADAAPDPAAAIIRNSGSTNTLPYTLVVRPGGDAEVTVGDSTQHRTLAKAQSDWLFAQLAAAAPLDALPAAHCMRSASFGTSTTITLAGRTTPDLNCATGPLTRELARTVQTIVDQLGIRLMRHPAVAPAL